MIPNCELLTDLKFVEKSCDIFSSGSVIGEVGFLKNQERAAEATCETFVTAYHFSNELLEEASNSFTNDASSVQPFDSFESRVWASWGLQVATALLKRHPEYDVSFLGAKNGFCLYAMKSKFRKRIRKHLNF